MDIRDIYLDYFKRNDHLILPSSSLIPENDPSVLLTTAGMQQFKPYYLGVKKPPYPRISTVQKSFRTSDIDSIGSTDRHLTFFEMLGNFSFGNYFKKESIKFALEFLLDVLKIPKEKFWVTIFSGQLDLPIDEESRSYWIENGVDKNRIFEYGMKDNFWGPAGDTGPCGPCTEIIYDFGAEYGCQKKECSPNCDCGRFLEIWNLVFTQYNFDGKKYTELPNKNIDTGMGLERITAAIEGKVSVFDTSLFKNILKKIEQLSGKKISHASKDSQDISTNKSIKVIADHVRAIYFLISDGVIPSNEGRGYILRRIIRRAVRFGKVIGIDKYFLNDLGKVLIDDYASVYPELLNRKDFSFKVVIDEEKRFSKTLKEGIKILNQHIAELKESSTAEMNSKDAFRLYETYGFPVELTLEILKENDLSLDMESFKSYLNKHSIDSKRKTVFDKKVDNFLNLYKDIFEQSKTEFVGYENDEYTSNIEAIIHISEDKKEIKDFIEEGQNAEIILEKTPFYGEKGGQVGDGGLIKTEKGSFLVEDTIIPIEGLIVHIGKVLEGKIFAKESAKAKVDPNFRKNISKNHTATHLLHWALRSIFGKEVTQAGSLVSNEKLRFDYNLYTSGCKDNVLRIEKMINEKIQNNDLVKVFETTKEYADEIGVISLFNEKYGKFVRVVEVNNYSRELCGGIHVKRTGDIGIFKIISDSGIGANLRRIEAITSMTAFNYLNKKDKILQKINDKFEINEEKILEYIETFKAENESLRQEMTEIALKIAKDRVIADKQKIEKYNGIDVLEINLTGFDHTDRIDVKNMSVLGDELRDLLKEKRMVLLIGNTIKGKPAIVLQKGSNVDNPKIKCSSLAKEAGKIIKGGGGGKENFAQAGGQDPDSLEAALKYLKQKVIDLIEAP